MMFRGWIVLVAASAVIVNACSNDTREASGADLDKHANYFVPADAFDVVTAPDIPWVQKSFNVIRKPGEFAVDADTLSRAKADGWKLCQQLNPEWLDYPDAALTPPRHTKQKTYALHKDGVLIVLVGKYYGDTQGTSVATDDMNQHGMVIARRATNQEAQEAVDSFKLSCD